MSIRRKTCIWRHRHWHTDVVITQSNGTSGVVGQKSRQRRKLRFSDRLQISDKGDYGCAKFQLCP